MKKTLILITVIAVVIITGALAVFAASAEPEEIPEGTSETVITEKAEDNTKTVKAIAAAAVVGAVAVAAAIAMGLTITKSTDGIARQPEAESGIRSAMMLGLVFIETVVIYALVVAILIVFVL